jgi:hypothetical protein
MRNRAARDTSFHRAAVIPITGASYLLRAASMPVAHDRFHDQQAPDRAIATARRAERPAGHGAGD